jgi:hypothetical protein
MVAERCPKKSRAAMPAYYGAFVLSKTWPRKQGRGSKSGLKSSADLHRFLRWAAHRQNLEQMQRYGAKADEGLNLI